MRPPIISPSFDLTSQVRTENTFPMTNLRNNHDVIPIWRITVNVRSNPYAKAWAENTKCIMRVIYTFMTTFDVYVFAISHTNVMLLCCSCFLLCCTIYCGVVYVRTDFTQAMLFVFAISYHKRKCAVVVSYIIIAHAVCIYVSMYPKNFELWR